LKTADIIVIGGGVTGAAVALGLMRNTSGKVILFDDKPGKQRLSRTNFGLTGFMCKGANSSVYARWSRNSCFLWPEFAKKLESDSGMDVDLAWTGGAVHCVGREQWEASAAGVENLKNVCAEAGLDYPVEMLDRNQFQEVIPKMEVGEKVSGAMYTREQGHINPLALLGALRRAFIRSQGEFLPHHSVRKIIPKNGRAIVKTNQGDFEAAKVVVAAGHGSTRILKDIGTTLNIYPQRGQLMVSERCEPGLLPLAVLAVRQNGEGTFQIGLSTEDAAHDVRVTPRTLQNQARGAIELFPKLANVNWLRAWAGIRVMTRDGAPVYDTVPGYDNIFMLALHSAVALTPMHATSIASWIAGGPKPEEVEHFNNGRFDV